MKAVTVVGFRGVQALDIVGPFETFTSAARFVDDEAWQSTGYEVALASVGGEPVAASTGLVLSARPLPEPDQVDTVVIPGGVGISRNSDPALIEWVKETARHARRIVSVCTGAFLLAEAGLLDGRQATTHWAFAERLAQRYPEVRVDPNLMFVRSSQQVWTAAGVSAGIDLSLALVELDHGTEVAKAVARWLVLHLRRPGSQGQFAAPVWTPRARRDEIRHVQEAIEADPAAPHTMGTLAAAAAMSVRHFTRVFTSEIGEGPGHTSTGSEHRQRVASLRRPPTPCRPLRLDVVSAPQRPCAETSSGNSASRRTHTARRSPDIAIPEHSEGQRK